LLQAEISRDDSLPPAFKYFEISPAVYWFDPMRDANLPDLRTVSQGFETSIPGSGRNVPGVGKADQDSFTARLKWDFANLAFTSLTGYRETDFDWINDGDGFDTFFVNYFQSDRSEQITQEFQLTNSGSERLNWIAGLYYLNEKSEQFNGIPFLLSNLGFPAAGPGEYILWDAESEVNAFAVFGQMTYAFTDRLKGTFGLRYNKEKKEAVFAYDLFDLGVFPILDLNDDWSSTTPRVVFDFDFTDDVMGYFSATRGFKSGGYNFIAFQGPYDPEKVWAYELGLKSKLADGKVVLNLGAFFYDYEDLHVGKVVNLSASVVNADKAKIKGMEAELRAAPMPGFEISASIALLDTEYEDFVTEDPGYSANPMAPGAIGCGRPVDATTRNVSLAGCELPRAPDVQGTLGFSWKKGLANGGTFNLRGDYAYRGKQFFTQFNRANVSQDGYGLVNLRVGYGAPDDKWAVTLYGDNLADEEYFSTVLESGVAAPGTVVPQAILGPPRTYGVVFQYNF
jgi:iron complex outermembrane receptor protein